MPDFAHLRSVCKTSTNFSISIIDEFLIPYAAQRDQLEREQWRRGRLERFPGAPGHHPAVPTAAEPVDPGIARGDEGATEENPPTAGQPARSIPGSVGSVAPNVATASERNGPEIQRPRFVAPRRTRQWSWRGWQRGSATPLAQCLAMV